MAIFIFIYLFYKKKYFLREQLIIIQKYYQLLMKLHLSLWYKNFWSRLSIHDLWKLQRGLSCYYHTNIVFDHCALDRSSHVCTSSLILRTSLVSPQMADVSSWVTPQRLAPNHLKSETFNSCVASSFYASAFLLKASVHVKIVHSCSINKIIK